MYGGPPGPRGSSLRNRRRRPAPCTADPQVRAGPPGPALRPAAPLRPSRLSSNAGAAQSRRLNRAILHETPRASRAILAHISRRPEMPTSLYAPDFLSVFNRNRDAGGPLTTFPSPADWRDQWIYFLMVDRFNNSQQPRPPHRPSTIPITSIFRAATSPASRTSLRYIKGSRRRRHLAQPRADQRPSSARHVSRLRHPRLPRVSTRASPATPPTPTTNSAPWSTPRTSWASTSSSISSSITPATCSPTYATRTKPTASPTRAPKPIFALPRAPSNGATTRTMPAPIGPTSPPFLILH